MEMKVLLVDDDELLVEKIVEGLDWEGMGVSMVFTANNIRQAKEILSEYSIQLLISDIEMPQGNGLELLEWVKKQEIRLKCIFISSYAYFTYAQKAIQLNSSQYLLKPVSDQELSQAIVEVLSTMKREDQSLQEEEQKEKQRFWADCLEARRGSDFLMERVWQQAEKLYNPEDRFGLIWIKVFPKPQEKPWKKQHYYACQIEEAVERAWAGKGFHLETMVKYQDLEWVLVGKSEGAFSAEAALGAEGALKPEQGAKLLEKELLDTMEENFYLLFGSDTEKLSQMGPAMEKLMAASRRMIVSAGRLVDITKWDRRRKADMELRFPEWKREILCTEHLTELGERILQAMEKECEEAKVSRQEFEQYRRALSQLAFLWLEHQKLQPFQFFNNTEFDEKYDRAAGCMEDMRCFIRWMFGKMDGYRRTDSRQEIVVEKLKLYIEQNLKEDLTRKELAKVVFLSEDYVAKLFSGETCMSISSYVTRRRMEKAQEYLWNTDWNVSRIAMEVGYTNFSYFSKMFREFAGCTPNEYRNRNAKNKG